MAGNVPLKHYKTSELISKFGRLAQTSQYYVLVSPNSIRNVSQQAPEKGFVFDSSFAGENLGMYCNEASLPGNSLATTEMNTDFPGVSQKFPYRKIYNNLQLTFYVDSSYDVIKFFESWMSYIASPYGWGEGIYEQSGAKGSYRFNYPDNYKCDVFVAKFNKDNSLNNKISYRFINSFPIDITSMPVSYDSTEILKCTVSFAYDRYVFDKTGKLSSAVAARSSSTSKDEPTGALNGPINPVTGKPVERTTSGYLSDNEWNSAYSSGVTQSGQRTVSPTGVVGPRER